MEDKISSKSLLCFEDRKHLRKQQRSQTQCSIAPYFLCNAEMKISANWRRALALKGARNFTCPVRAKKGVLSKNSVLLL